MVSTLPGKIEAGRGYDVSLMFHFHFLVRHSPATTANLIIIKCSVMNRFPLSRIGVKLIFSIHHLNTVILCSSRMASLSQRRCFRFFEKNFLRIFFNHAFGVTEPKEAPYVTTGNNLKLQTLITQKLKLALYLKRLQLFLNLTPMRCFGA